MLQEHLPQRPHPSPQWPQQAEPWQGAPQGMTPPAMYEGYEVTSYPPQMHEQSSPGQLSGYPGPGAEREKFALHMNVRQELEAEF